MGFFGLTGPAVWPEPHCETEKDQGGKTAEEQNFMDISEGGPIGLRYAVGKLAVPVFFGEAGMAVGGMDIRGTKSRYSTVPHSTQVIWVRIWASLLRTAYAPAGLYDSNGTIEKFLIGVSSKVWPQVEQTFSLRLLGSLTTRFWTFTVPACCAARGLEGAGGGSRV